MNRPLLKIENLTFTYQEATAPVLKDIELQIQPGEFLTITGPSGCGKSTLSLCMAGFIPHSFPGTMVGSIEIMGEDTRKYPPGGLAGIVGLVQQDPEAQLCTLNVINEVAFGLENLCVPPQQIKKKVHQALKKVLALNLQDRQVHTLSGGEKQRIAIASILAMDPALLILDEPTSFLDPRCTVEVLEVLQELKNEKGISILIIEHRLKQLMTFSDRLIIMENGKIVQELKKKPFAQQIQQYFPVNPYLPSGSGKQMRKKSLSVDKKTSILTVKNLRAGYGKKDVLSGVSFQLYAGEITAIMGDNGSGKTTLIHSLLGINPLREGSITLKGRTINSATVTERAKNMGLTFQNPNHQLFEKTVWKEALLPSLFLSEKDPQKNREIITSLLNQFQLYQYREKNPFTLSLGEKKRLTLISILAYAPTLFILDEPFVGQDHQRLTFLLQALAEHQECGGSSLLICHEPDFVASFCHRILFLQQGKLLINEETPMAFETLWTLKRLEYLPPAYVENRKKEEKQWDRNLEEDPEIEYLDSLD